MKDKKDNARFTIQFNLNNPLHTQAVEVLNGQSPRGKAQYITTAILHYESCDETPNAKHQSAHLDEKAVVEIIERFISNRGIIGGRAQQAPTSLLYDSGSQIENPRTTEEIIITDYDEPTAEAVNHFVEALELFKRK